MAAVKGSSIDVAINVFAKPYQTALSVLSLLRFSGEHIENIFFQFEPYGSEFDTGLPYAIAHYLEERPELARPVIFQAQHWLQLDPADPERFSDTDYRRSIRYQYAFEVSAADYLLVIHNDILVLRDFAGALLENIGDAFACGEVGQCWNCPASQAGLLCQAGLDYAPCSSSQYDAFRPSVEELVRLYDVAARSTFIVRPYWEGWQERYIPEPWPLPECRVNEWGCLVNLRLTRPLTVPFGTVPPFGAFESCGSIALDTSVAWFRELNRQGLRARHMDIHPYMRHWVGNGKMSRKKYVAAELNARMILERQFPDFINWCRKHCTGLFM